MFRLIKSRQLVDLPSFRRACASWIDFSDAKRLLIPFESMTGEIPTVDAKARKSTSMPADISALPADYTGTLRLQCALSGYESWIPVVATSGPFPLDVFLQICREIVLHPERSRSFREL